MISQGKETMASVFVEDSLAPGLYSSPLPAEDAPDEALPAYYPETEDREQQIRLVFGVPRGVSFPFVAEVYRDASPAEDRHHTVTVRGLLPPARHRKTTSSGLFCLARKGSVVLELPVAELEVREEGENQRLIEDYWYWFWNWR
jgi:hypothetical protein